MYPIHQLRESFEQESLLTVARKSALTSRIA